MAAAFGGSTASPSPSGSGSGSPSSSASPSPSAPPSSSPSSSPLPGGCTVAYRIANQWTGGFTADVTVTNKGTSAIGPWQVGWQFGA
ncbi:cellulose binding domain-containing protein [Kitasatospora arboriphila]